MKKPGLGLEVRRGYQLFESPCGVFPRALIEVTLTNPTGRSQLSSPSERGGAAFVGLSPQSCLDIWQGVWH